jgi:hypothetical protein
MQTVSARVNIPWKDLVLTPGYVQAPPLDARVELVVEASPRWSKVEEIALELLNKTIGSAARRRAAFQPEL